MDKFKSRSLSWSSISQFQYDREKWYDKYIHGILPADNAAMSFGKKIGMKLSSDFTFLPEVPRLPIFEKELRGKIDDIKLVGYLDAFQKNPMAFLEYKTSSNKERWNQKKAEEHGQIMFYYMLLWLEYGVPPEDIKSWLVYIPCEETASFEVKLSGAPAQIFPLKKTSADILRFGNFIKQIHKEMKEYIVSYPQMVVAA